jgi:hypothetical protein
VTARKEKKRKGQWKRREGIETTVDAHYGSEEVHISALDRLRLEEVVDGELNTTALDSLGSVLRPNLLASNKLSDSKARRGRAERNAQS